MKRLAGSSFDMTSHLHAATASGKIMATFFKLSRSQFVILSSLISPPPDHLTLVVTIRMRNPVSKGYGLPDCCFCVLECFIISLSAFDFACNINATDLRLELKPAVEIPLFDRICRGDGDYCIKLSTLDEP